MEPSEGITLPNVHSDFKSRDPSQELSPIYQGETKDFRKFTCSIMIFRNFFQSLNPQVGAVSILFCRDLMDQPASGRGYYGGSRTQPWRTGSYFFLLLKAEFPLYHDRAPLDIFLMSQCPCMPRSKTSWCPCLPRSSSQHPKSQPSSSQHPIAQPSSSQHPRPHPSSSQHLTPQPSRSKCQN